MQQPLFLSGLVIIGISNKREEFEVRPHQPIRLKQGGLRRWQCVSQTTDKDMWIKTSDSNVAVDHVPKNRDTLKNNYFWTT